MARRVTLDELVRIREAARAEGRLVVLANGLFDLLHVGHLRFLEAARREGDLLVVAVNGDRSAEMLKGPGRPVVPAEERAELVAGFACVDYVLTWDQLTMDGLIERLRPDVHAKGPDYERPERVPEYEAVRAHGGRTALVGDPKDHASRDLIKAIVARFGRG